MIDMLCIILFAMPSVSLTIIRTLEEWAEVKSNTTSYSMRRWSLSMGPKLMVLYSRVIQKVSFTNSFLEFWRIRRLIENTAYGIRGVGKGTRVTEYQDEP